MLCHCGFAECARAVEYEQFIFQTPKRGGTVMAYLFVSSWLFVGAFILTNFITGSMARSYATTRDELVAVRQEAEAARNAVEQRNQLMDKVSFVKFFSILISS